MRIGFDATNILGYGGIKTYARELVRGLAQQYPEDTFHLLSTFSSARRDKLLRVFQGMPNVRVTASLPHIRMLGEPMRPLTGALTSLMWMRVSRRVDLVHLTDPYGTAALPRRFVSTVHDLFPLTRNEYCGSVLERFYRKRTPLILDRSTAVITPSNYVKDQVLELYPDIPAPVTVIPEAASGEFRPGSGSEELPFSLRPGGRFFLFVGRDDPRKNLPRIVEAYRKLPGGLRAECSLVMVTGGKPLDTAVNEDGLIFLRDRSAADLRRLYSSALAFLFPSLDEGFGLPVIEAMSSGCPVITSNRSCLPETAAGAAVLVDPEDTAGISNAMRNLASSPRLRDEYIARGLERAAEFSWERTAMETMKVYRSAADATG